MIDSTALLSLVTVRDNESFILVKDLENIFLTQTPKLFQQMYRGIELQQPELISRSVHTLKTSCYYLGIIEMAELCKKIELETSHQNISFFDISFLLQKLERAYFDSVVELKKLVTNIGNHTSSMRTSTQAMSI